VTNGNVRYLRCRISRATQAGEQEKVQSLQMLMLCRCANTMVSVRQMTQANRGKHTPSVDYVVIKASKARGRLVDDLRSSQP